MRRETPTPPRWGDDELTRHLDAVRKNQFATFVQKPETKTIIGIDRSFRRILHGWINPRDLNASLFMTRAHSAYRTAASCALAGQSAELYPILRLMLEQAGYAILINRNPMLAEVWLTRSKSKTHRAKSKGEFEIWRIKDTLVSIDKGLEDTFGKLYDRTIDLGAHPNEMSVTSSLGIVKKEDRKDFSTIYLHGDGPVLDGSLRTLAQVGVCVLLIFQEIFRERFELLGVSSKLQNLREGL